MDWTRKVNPVTYLAANHNETKGGKMQIRGDSLVLAKTNPGNLCFDNVVKGSVTVRSTFLAGTKGSIVFTEGTDLVVDYSKGAVARTTNSRDRGKCRDHMF